MDLFEYCDIGGRDINEDFTVVCTKEDACIFVVADGLGGHQSGEFASECVAKAISEEFMNNPECSKAVLTEIFDSAQKKLLSEAEDDPSKNGMRTTVVVLCRVGGKIIWGHIGDSRLYRIRDNEIKPLTADHSVAYLSYATGEISYDDIRISTDQNKLIRCMGSKDKFKPDISDVHDVCEGDGFLLCSDGFWEHISENDMLDAFKKSKTSSRWLARMVNIILKNAASVPKRDNCSAITVII